MPQFQERLHERFDCKIKMLLGAEVESEQGRNVTPRGGERNSLLENHINNINMLQLNGMSEVGTHRRDD